MTLKLVLRVCGGAVRVRVPLARYVGYVDAHSSLDAHNLLRAAFALGDCLERVNLRLELGVEIATALLGALGITKGARARTKMVRRVAQLVRVVIGRAKQLGDEVGERLAQRRCAGADDSDGRFDLGPDDGGAGGPCKILGKRGVEIETNHAFNTRDANAAGIVSDLKFL